MVNTYLSKMEGLIGSVFDDMVLSSNNKQSDDRMNSQSSIVFLAQMLEFQYGMAMAITCDHFRCASCQDICLRGEICRLDFWRP